MLNKTTTLALTAGSLLLGLSHTAIAVASDDVVATVNGKNINTQAITEYVTEHKMSMEVATQQRARIIDELISRELVIQDAQAKKLEKRPEVIAELKRLKMQVLLNAAVQEALSKDPITDEELRKQYDAKLPQMVQTEYKARHILVNEEAEAKSIIEELKKGADFAELAKTKSTGPSGKNGGDLGFFSPQQMVPPFSAAVMKLKDGAFTQAPVQTQFGWHVILREDSRTSEPPSFEQIKPQIQQFVQQEHIMRYISGLRDKAKITKN